MLRSIKEKIIIFCILMVLLYAAWSSLSYYFIYIKKQEEYQKLERLYKNVKRSKKKQESRLWELKQQ
jgi:hypothetical protein